MKLNNLFVILSCCFLFSSCSNEGSHNIDIKKSLSVYSLNDSHGDLLRDIDTATNGFDSISGLIKKDKEINKDNLSFNIALGDMFQGQFVSEITKGLPVIDALNYLDCKAFVIGNHEFDWTLEEMHKYKDGDLSNGELNCDFLAANIIEKETSKMPSWIKPYAIINIDEYKIGIIGFMGEDIENTILPGMVDGYEIVSTLPLYQKYSKELKEIKHCDLIFAAVHDYKDIYKEFMNSEYPPDTIFGAHTHTFNLEYLKNKKSGLNIPFIQAGSDNRGVSKVTYTFNKDKLLTNILGEHLLNDHPDDYLDLNLSKMISDKYVDSFLKSNEVIKENFKKMDEQGWMEFVAEALYKYKDYEADIGVINKTSIRSSTSFATSNTLYYKQILRILPYQNKIFHVKIDKNIFDEYMEHNTSNCFIKNIHQTINDYYLINVIDFVYNLPSEHEVWKNATIIDTLELKVQDYIIKYIKEL